MMSICWVVSIIGKLILLQSTKRVAMMTSLMRFIRIQNHILAVTLYTPIEMETTKMQLNTIYKPIMIVSMWQYWSPRKIECVIPKMRFLRPLWQTSISMPFISLVLFSVRCLLSLAQRWQEMKQREALQSTTPKPKSTQQNLSSLLPTPKENMFFQSVTKQKASCWTLPSSRITKRKGQKSNLRISLEIGQLYSSLKSTRNTMNPSNVIGIVTRKQFWQFAHSPSDPTSTWSSSLKWNLSQASWQSVSLTKEVESMLRKSSIFWQLIKLHFLVQIPLRLENRSLIVAPQSRSWNWQRQRSSKTPKQTNAGEMNFLAAGMEIIWVRIEMEQQAIVELKNENEGYAVWGQAQVGEGRQVQVVFSSVYASSQTVHIEGAMQQQVQLLTVQLQGTQELPDIQDWPVHSPPLQMQDFPGVQKRVSCEPKLFEYISSGRVVRSELRERLRLVELQLSLYIPIDCTRQQVPDRQKKFIVWLRGMLVVIPIVEVLASHIVVTPVVLDCIMSSPLVALRRVMGEGEVKILQEPQDTVEALQWLMLKSKVKLSFILSTCTWLLLILTKQQKSAIITSPDVGIGNEAARTVMQVTPAPKMELQVLMVTVFPMQTTQMEEAVMMMWKIRVVPATLKGKPTSLMMVSLKWQVSPLTQEQQLQLRIVVRLLDLETSTLSFMEKELPFERVAETAYPLEVNWSIISGKVNSVQEVRLGEYLLTCPLENATRNWFSQSLETWLMVALGRRRSEWLRLRAKVWGDATFIMRSRQAKQAILFPICSTLQNIIIDRHIHFPYQAFQGQSFILCCGAYCQEQGKGVLLGRDVQNLAIFYDQTYYPFKLFLLVCNKIRSFQVRVHRRQAKSDADWNVGWEKGKISLISASGQCMEIRRI